MSVKNIINALNMVCTLSSCIALGASAQRSIDVHERYMSDVEKEARRESENLMRQARFLRQVANLERNNRDIALEVARRNEAAARLAEEQKQRDGC